MKRHAYLILAYHQWDLLKTLIRMIDDDRNDIYVHIDLKSPITSEIINDLVSTAQSSKVVFVDRHAIYRGMPVISAVELMLVKAALSHGDYSYLHLLSGQDLPIKKQDYIHDLFLKNEGLNFIDLIPPDKVTKHQREGTSLYHFFLKKTFGHKSLISDSYRSIYRSLKMIQRLLHVNRFHKYEKKGYEFCYGSSWFSITNEFAKYLIEQENMINEMYGKYTSVAEESFVQTIFYNSPFKNTLFQEYHGESNCRGNLRYIVWTGNTSPETITMSMLDDIESTPAIFARKFDLNTDKIIIKKIEDLYGISQGKSELNV